ncbi:DsbA family protein [Rhodotorula paludigena]|uniref:DsbA family protein n=1 Tax=Rhodotorula paludigena TaxID=86838 RepID=UPI00316D416C
MALAPQFATHRIAGTASASHTLELFLDLICPFSKKQLDGVREHVVPLIEKGPLEQHLSVIVRQVPQPWHASSTLVHEAALGVSKTLVDAGASFSDVEVHDKFKQFFYRLMDGQEAYYDEPTATETPNQTRARLADLANEVVGLDRDAFLKAVSVGKGNGGTGVTADLKLQIKYHRARGVHVTPTVFLDGLAEPSISSSFSGEDWKKFIQEKILPSDAPKL